MANVCVFCGSRSGVLPEFGRVAAEFGEILATQGHTLVYGGGRTGIMGILADAVLRRNGRIIGVIPKHLARSELMHDCVMDMRITADMHQRKALMHQLADVYVALPGGFGTLEELFETLTWAQLELHNRPVALLNTAGLFDGLMQMLDQMTQQGFLTPTCRSHLYVLPALDAFNDWLAGAASNIASGNSQRFP